MKNFLINLARFALVPAILLIVWVFIYVLMDPFKVIGHYESFYDNNAKAHIIYNQDYVSTQTFDNNYKKQSYNSFIFGNSRSMFYQISDWKRYIGNNNRGFHFDASGEALYAMHKKILYVDKKNVKINHALIILDFDLLKRDKPNEGPLFLISPQLVNNKNLLSFHFTYFRSFTYPSFFLPVIYYKLTDNIPPFMKEALDYKQRRVDPISNELQFELFEKMIKEGKYYTKERLTHFYKRAGVLAYYPPSISSAQKSMLIEIKEIFLKHHTKYKIIISPLYDQVKFNQSDLEYLKSLFGEENVFDYSGINDITQNHTNYYESSHYRPIVARKILDDIYNE